METSYTSDMNLLFHEVEYTSLLENGFIPVESEEEK